jgi:hypothetical protein
MVSIFTINIQSELLLPNTEYEHKIQHSINLINILCSNKFLKLLRKTQHLIFVNYFDLLRNISLKKTP